MKHSYAIWIFACLSLLAGHAGWAQPSHQSADAARLDALKPTAALGANGANYQRAYLWAKAQHWLYASHDEARNGNRALFPQAARQQALLLLDALESTSFTALTQADVWFTRPMLGSNGLRDDLWQPTQLWAQLSLEGAPLAQAGARCALPDVARTQVQLVWAGWVSSHYGWRSALPYIAAGEKHFNDAQLAFTRCRDAAAYAADLADDTQSTQSLASTNQ